MEYVILEGITIRELTRKVNQYIAQGWRPQGGIAIEAHDQYHNTAYYQAMVRGE